MNAKAFIKRMVPRVALDPLRRFYQTVFPCEPIRFTGNYQSWEAAEHAATGYSAPEILAKTRAAMLKVTNGEAAFERDSVAFSKMQHEFPLLAGLLRAASADEGRLSVLDFGGALGSTYFQCREYLSVIKDLRWSVVEQPAHVVCGKAEFASDQLCFYRTIDECVRAETPNVMLLSSVIQYLRDPYEFLRNELRHEIDYIVVDRTAFTQDDKDLLTVQHVPEWIYRASYPAWFLSETRLKACFTERYEIVCEYPGADTCQPDHGVAYFKGIQFKMQAARGSR